MTKKNTIFGYYVALGLFALSIFVPWATFNNGIVFTTTLTNGNYTFAGFRIDNILIFAVGVFSSLLGLASCKGFASLPKILLYAANLVSLIFICIAFLILYSAPAASPLIGIYFIAGGIMLNVYLAIVGKAK